MYGLISSSQFAKDLKRINKQGNKKGISKLEEVIKKLQNGEKLDIIHRDHKLNANTFIKEGSRGCHIFNDLILVYLIKDNILYLEQLGDHHTLKGFKESLNDGKIKVERR